MNSLDVIARGEALGQTIVATLPRLLLATTLLFLLARLIDRALERRISAGTRVLLYVPLALRLVVPLSMGSPLGILGARAHERAGAAEVLLGAPVVAASSVARSTIGVGTAVLVAYLVGVLFWLVRSLRARSRIALASLSARPALLARVETVPLLVHDHLGPLVIGLWHPRIVVPSELAAASDRETIGFVLRHELAHIARRDHWLAAGLQIICACAWPLLPIWLAAARIRALMELACDERALGGQSIEIRRRYGEVLLALADGRLPGSSVAAVPSFGSALRDRIRALRWRRHWPRWTQLGLVVGVGGLAFACASPPNEDPGDGAAATADAIEAPAAIALPPSFRASPAQPPPQKSSKPESGKEETRLPADVAATTAIVQGSLDRNTIRKVIRAHIQEVKACYEVGLARDHSLGGRVVAQFTIAPTGAIVAAEINESASSLNVPDVSACMTKAIRTWRFPAPQGGVVVVSYPFTFTPSSARATPQRSGSQPSGAHSGALDPRVIATVVRSHMSEVKTCYEQALRQDSHLGGRLLLEFTVTSGGAVSGGQAHFAEAARAIAPSASPDSVAEPGPARGSDLETCLISLARNWRFPPPVGGSVDVKFPFVLAAGEPAAGQPSRPLSGRRP